MRPPVRVFSVANLKPAGLPGHCQMVDLEEYQKLLARYNWLIENASNTSVIDRNGDEYSLYARGEEELEDLVTYNLERQGLWT